jgi:hypothetical protein
MHPSVPCAIANKGMNYNRPSLFLLDSLGSPPSISRI